MANGESSTSSDITTPIIGEVAVDLGSGVGTVEDKMANAFRKLLLRGKDDNNFICTKLTPGGEGKFHAKDFEESLANMRMQYLHMYLIHYPAAPKSLAKCAKNVTLQTESWVAVTELHDQTKVNAIAVQNYSIKHFIQLSEIIAIGPVVQEMRWYSYYNYSQAQFSLSNIALMENPVVKSLAGFHKLSRAQILLQWALQRGGAVTPALTNGSFVMENIQFSTRLSNGDMNLIESFIRLHGVNF